MVPTLVWSVLLLGHGFGVRDITGTKNCFTASPTKGPPQPKCSHVVLNTLRPLE